MHINEGLAEANTMMALARPYVVIRSFCLHMEIMDEETQDTALIFQCNAPKIPGRADANDAQALQILRAVCNGLLANTRNSFNIVSPRGMAEWVGPAPADAAAAPQTLPNLPNWDGLIRLPADRYDCNAVRNVWTLDHCRSFIAYVADKQPAMWKETLNGLYAAMFVGVAKRGEVSGMKLTSISRDIRSETNINLPTNPMVYRSIYRVCGDALTAANASATFTRWIGDLPANALRVRLTLTQAAGSGLTQTSTIVRCISLHPNFY
jgi:hypothetical protein